MARIPYPAPSKLGVSCTPVTPVPSGTEKEGSQGLASSPPRQDDTIPGLSERICPKIGGEWQRGNSDTLSWPLCTSTCKRSLSHTPQTYFLNKPKTVHAFFIDSYNSSPTQRIPSSFSIFIGSHHPGSGEPCQECRQKDQAQSMGLKHHNQSLVFIITAISHAENSSLTKVCP